jgi:CRISPR type III-A-associated RAMP protein Csm5
MNPPQRYTLTCLSPVHVGTGQTLGKLDGFYKDHKWHRLDLDTLLEQGLIEPDTMLGMMQEPNFSWAPWLRYRQGMAETLRRMYDPLPCAENPGESLIREAIKDVYHQPYLPGTSIKGAIRTAVAWWLFQQDEDIQIFTNQYLILAAYAEKIAEQVHQYSSKSSPGFHFKAVQKVLNLNQADAETATRMLYDLLNKNLEKAERSEGRHTIGPKEIRYLLNSARFLAQHLEKRLLGRDPNHDLMRALHVEDTAPVPVDRLAIGMVWIHTIREKRLVPKKDSGKDYRIFLEWLLPETILSVNFRQDAFLFSPAGQKLGFRPPQRQALQRLHETCNGFAKAIIQSEQAFLRQQQGPPEAVAFYQDLQQQLDSLPEGTFLLNVGWGGGWRFKTVGDFLAEKVMGVSDFNWLRQRYQMGRNPETKHLDLHNPFPKTRRFGYAGGVAHWPMGWVRLTPASTPR